MIDLKRYARIKPIMHVDGKRPIAFPTSKYVIQLHQKPDGTFITGHTPEELREYTTLNVEDKKFLESFQFVIPGTGKTLDMDNEYDRFIYRVLRTSRFVTFNPDAYPAGAIFYVQDEEKEEGKAAVQNRRMSTCYAMIDSMSPDEQKEFLFLYGDNVKTKSNDAVYNILVERARRDPERFVRSFDDKYKDQRVLLNKVLVYNIVKKKNSSYFYEDFALGASEKEAIDFIFRPENRDVLNQLISLVATKENINPAELAISTMPKNKKDK